jgi:hypothetical protein
VRNVKGKKKKPAFTFHFHLSVPVEEIVKWDAAKMKEFFEGFAVLVQLKYDLHD